MQGSVYSPDLTHTAKRSYKKQMSYQDLILAGISLTNVDRLMTLNRIDNALNLNVYRKSINNLNFYSLTTKQNPEYLSGSI